jgi:hypothetical protein
MEIIKNEESSNQTNDNTFYINLIKNQTNYDESTIVEKLKLYNNDYIKIIKEYMNIPEKPKEKITSINQEIYKQLRKKIHIPPEKLPL